MSLMLFRSFELKTDAMISPDELMPWLAQMVATYCKSLWLFVNIILCEINNWSNYSFTLLVERESEIVKFLVWFNYTLILNCVFICFQFPVGSHWYFPLLSSPQDLKIFHNSFLKTLSYWNWFLRCICLHMPMSAHSLF